MITSLSWGRVVWILVTLVALALSAAGVPARYEQLVKVCHNGEFCGQFGSPLSARFLPDLYAAGLTLQFYAVFTIFVETATAFVSVALGALLVVLARSGLV